MSSEGLTLSRLNNLNKRRGSGGSMKNVFKNTQPKCGKCSKSVYEAEKVVLGGNIVWHKSCLRCGLSKCNRLLAVHNFRKVGDQVFCETHAKDAERNLSNQYLNKPQSSGEIEVIRGESMVPTRDRPGEYINDRSLNYVGVPSPTSSSQPDVEVEPHVAADATPAATSDASPRVASSRTKSKPAPMLRRANSDPSSTSATKPPTPILKMPSSTRRRSMDDDNDSVSSRKSVSFANPECQVTTQEEIESRMIDRAAAEKKSRPHGSKRRDSSVERALREEVKRERNLSDQLAGELTEYERAVEGLLAEKQALEEVVKKMKKSEAPSSTSADLQTRIDDLVAEKKQMTDEMAQFAEYYTQMEQKCAQLEANASTAEAPTASMAALNKIISELTSQVQKLEKDLKSEKEALTREQRAVKQEKNSAKRAQDAHALDAKAKDDEIANLHEAIEQARTDEEALTKKADALADEVSKLTTKLDRANAQVTQLSKSKSNIGETVKALHAVEAELEVANEQIETLSAEVETLNLRNEEMSQHVESASEQATSKTDDLEKLNAVLRQENANLSTEIEEITQAVVKSEAELKDQIKSLEDQIAAAAAMERTMETTNTGTQADEAIKDIAHQSTQASVETATTETSTDEASDNNDDDDDRVQSQNAQATAAKKDKPRTETDEVQDNSDHDEAASDNGNDEEYEVDEEVVNEFMEAIKRKLRFKPQELRVVRAGLMNQDEEITAAAEEWNDTKNARRLQAIVRTRLAKQNSPINTRAIIRKAKLNSQLARVLTEGVKNKTIAHAAREFQDGGSAEDLIMVLEDECDEDELSNTSSSDEDTEEEGSASDDSQAPEKRGVLKMANAEIVDLVEDLNTDCMLNDRHSKGLMKGLIQKNLALCQATDRYLKTKQTKALKMAIDQFLRGKSPASARSTPSKAAGRRGSSSTRRTSNTLTRRTGKGSSVRGKGRRRGSSTDSESSQDGSEGGPSMLLVAVIISVFLWLIMMV